MLTTVVIIAVIIALVVGVIAIKNKSKNDPDYQAKSQRPDAPPGYNARSNDPAVRGTGNQADRTGNTH